LSLLYLKGGIDFVARRGDWLGCYSLWFCYLKRWVV
jgi:hypothetical protein